MLVIGKIVLAAAFGGAGIPFVERDQIAAERETACDSHRVLRAFRSLPAAFAGGRAHDKAACRNDHHLRCIGRIPDCRVRLVGTAWRIIVVRTGESLAAAALFPGGIF